MLTRREQGNDQKHEAYWKWLMKIIFSVKKSETKTLDSIQGGEKKEASGGVQRKPKAKFLWVMFTHFKIKFGVFFPPRLIKRLGFITVSHSLIIKASFPSPDISPE